METTLYRIQREDGSLIEGCWPLEQAQRRASWEDGAVTYVAMTEAEAAAERAKNLQWVLGEDA